MTTSDVAEKPEGKFVHSWLFVLLMGALVAFDPLSIDMYLPAFGDIGEDLNTTQAMVQFSLTAFFVGMTIGQLIYGPLSDRYGRKRPLQAGMMLYLLGTIGCAMSTSIGMLIGFRMVQAFGGCAGMVITRAVIRDLFDRKRSAMFFSSLMLVMGLAPILAPVVGAAIDHYVGWRAIFFLLAGMSAVCQLFILLFLPETNRSERRQMTISRVSRTYVGMLKDRFFMGYLLPDSFMRAALFAYVVNASFVFTEILQLSKLQFTFIFGSNAFALISAAQINRYFVHRHDPDRVLRVALVAVTVCSLLVVAVPTIEMQMFGRLSLASVWLPVMAFMTCFGFIGPNAQAIALEHQGHQAGMASAFYGTVAWGAAAIASAVVSALHNETIYPMTVGIFVSVALAMAVYFIMAIGRTKEQSPGNVPPATGELPGLNASPDPLDPAEGERST